MSNNSTVAFYLGSVVYLKIAINLNTPTYYSWERGAAKHFISWLC